MLSVKKFFSSSFKPWHVKQWGILIILFPILYSIQILLYSIQILQYIPRNMHTVFVLLCFVVVIHWLISPYPSGLLHWHCGNLTIAPVPAKQPWWIWINTSCEFIMNDCMTTTKQSTTKPCAYFLGYTVWRHTTLDIALPIMIGSYVRMASDCRISAKKHVSVKKAPSSAQPL